MLSLEVPLRDPAGHKVPPSPSRRFSNSEAMFEPMKSVSDNRGRPLKSSLTRATLKLLVGILTTAVPSRCTPNPRRRHDTVVHGRTVAALDL